ncbi:MAG: hypothetical protein ABIZ04_08785 [Opitutus sp.]
MKKWMYVISVGGMLAVFLFFYFSFLKQTEIKEKQRAEQVAQERKVEEERKAAIEAKARDDAAKRAAERVAAEEKKEADKLARWNAEGQKIQDATNAANAKADAYAKQISNLELELNTLRTNKEKLNREAFEFAKQVEQARVNKRNAELEIQRMTDMIAKRAADSSLTRMPPVAAAKPSS